MTVLIDPPAWPAHGTVFSHLVSDASLEELHAFARAAGLSERAFDRDHYDVPAHRRAELVARGAVPVSGRELVRRLAASGLRVPARNRAEKRDVVLARRWARLFEGTTASPDAVTTAGRDLLARWAEPHRHYHDPAHLLAVLESVDLLERAGAETGPDPRAVRLAAWFHDAVYAGDPAAPAGQDEADSAALAREVLTDPRLAVPADVVDEVARLVLLTAAHDPAPHDAAGAVLSDADLEVLGRSPEAYARYVAAVRRDYAHVSDADWTRGRGAVLDALLDAERLYRTAPAEHAGRTPPATPWRRNEPRCRPERVAPVLARDAARPASPDGETGLAGWAPERVGPAQRLITSCRPCRPSGPCPRRRRRPSRACPRRRPRWSGTGPRWTRRSAGPSGSPSPGR